MSGTRQLFAAIAVFMALAALGPTAPAFAQGNSDAAHACQQGGYLGLMGSNGETFANTGQCVSFAAHGGTFATGIIIPAGQTLTLNNAVFSACNALAYGYQVNGGAAVQADSKPDGCETVPAAGTTVGPFPTAVRVTVYLQDLTCGQTYDSDGNHALVTTLSATSTQVDLADSGGACERTGAWANPSAPGNLEVVATIS